MSDESQAFRVKVDDFDVIELATWFWPNLNFGRLHVLEMDRPHLLLGRVNCTARLESISADTLVMGYKRACRHAPEHPEKGGILVYLKLASPMDVPGDTLCMFLGCKVAAMKADPTWIYLGLRIVTQGEPENGEKAVKFHNVEKYGISDLTRWCDEKDRSTRASASPLRPGLHMDRLLTEIIAARRLSAQGNGKERPTGSAKP
jgi:hypothetical protein